MDCFSEFQIKNIRSDFRSCRTKKQALRKHGKPETLCFGACYDTLIYIVTCQLECRQVTCSTLEFSAEVVEVAFIIIEIIRSKEIFFNLIISVAHMTETKYFRF